MILRHSAIPKPDPIPTPTPRTPASAYARCDDCGTGQGEPCYDSHDRPCAPCPGRVLADSASYVRRERVQRSSAKPKPGPACWWCGSHPTGTAHSRPWCGATDCQRAIKAAYDRQYRKEGPTKPPPKPGPRRKSRAKPGPPSTCTVCGVVVQRGGRFCKAHKTERLQDLYARRLAAKAVPCWWCQSPLPLSGNAGGRFAQCDRPCCGDHACKRAIKRDFAERSRSTKPLEQEQQQHT